MKRCFFSPIPLCCIRADSAKRVSALLLLWFGPDGYRSTFQGPLVRKYANYDSALRLLLSNRRATPDPARRFGMNIDTRRLALSVGAAIAVLWTICSALVAIQPALMMSITAHMMHANMDGVGWTMTWTGFFVGLISWTICAAVTGWLIGWIYNYFGERSGG